MAAKQTNNDDDQLKMTIYLPQDLVHALDALKVQDQQDRRRTGVSINMTRPMYVVHALQEYVRHRTLQANDPSGGKSRPR